MHVVQRLAVLLVLAAATPLAAQNLLTNSNFNRNLNGWVAGPGASWSSADAEGSTRSGSGLGTNSSDEAALALLQLSQCVPVNAGQTYQAGTLVLVPGGQQRTGFVAVTVQWFAEEACGGPVLDVTELGDISSSVAWQPIASSNVTAPTGASSANLAFFVGKNEAGGTFSAHFDDTFFCAPSGCADEPIDAPWLTSAEYPDFRFRVRITSGSSSFPGAQVGNCQPDTVCVSGAVPGRAEVFLRILGPRPNGFLWPTIVRFTPSQVEVEIEQLSTLERQRYTLPAIPPGVDDLSGLQDREGFLP